MTRQRTMRRACFCLLLLLSASGCRDTELLERNAQARQHLRFGRPQEALDVLAASDVTSNSESHYLRTLALERLEMRKAAKEEIAKAIEQSSKTFKYRGLQWQLRLFQGDREAIERLIELHDQNRSSAALSFFVVFAHEARLMQRNAEKKIDEAKKEYDLAKEALRTSLALAADIPEFHRELIIMAIKYGLAADAERLADQLLEQEPDNLTITKDKISALLLNGNIASALRDAEKLYRRHGKFVESALIYATVLSRSEASPSHDRAFEDLIARYPFDMDILSRYALYLTRTERSDQACDIVDHAIAKQKNKTVKEKLIQLAISLPLEAVNMTASDRAELATRQLQQYESVITEPLLITYYEGRILYLQGKHQEALDKMVEVIEAQKRDSGGLRPFGAEALNWARQIMADGITSQQLQNALSAVKQALKADASQPGLSNNEGKADATAPEETSSDESSP